MLKVLVCGFGSIGKKHAYNASKMGHCVSVWRSRSGLIDEIVESGFRAASDLRGAVVEADIVVIATSTDKHLEVLKSALQHKKPVYLEKPVSHNMVDVEEVLSLGRGVPLQMGCQLRQHPCLKKLKQSIESIEFGEILTFQFWVGQLLSQWRSTDYRESYSSDGKRGGAALTDLVHEIDLVKWLVGDISMVGADLRNVGRLSMQGAEDLANLILVTDGGQSGTVQLDMVSPFWRRGGQIVCESGYYEWDLKIGCLWVTTDFGKQVLHQVEDSFSLQDLLFDHLEVFIDRYSHGSAASETGLEDGVRDLRVISAAKIAAKERTFRHVY